MWGIQRLSDRQWLTQTPDGEWFVDRTRVFQFTAIATPLFDSEQAASSFLYDMPCRELYTVVKT